MLYGLTGFTLLLTAADHWTTYQCLRSPVGGFDVIEANPIAAWLFQHLGLIGGLTLDSVVTLLGVGFLLYTPILAARVKAVYLAVVILATGLAVGNNIDAMHALGLPLLG